MVLYNRNANYAQDPALNGPFNDINPDRRHSMRHNMELERIRHHSAAMQVTMHCTALQLHSTMTVKIAQAYLAAPAAGPVLHQDLH